MTTQGTYTDMNKHEYTEHIHRHIQAQIHNDITQIHADIPKSTHTHMITSEYGQITVRMKFKGKTCSMIQKHGLARWLSV